MNANPQVCLSLREVTKHFGAKKAIDRVSFEVYAGEVAGLLGPNGAGKSTAIKCALGLLSRDGGEVAICGYDTKRQFPQAMACVGAVIENPDLYGYLSGRQNLQLMAHARGCSKQAVEDALTLVGMQQRGRDRMKRYSLGMKQRLGLAQALLHNPKLLILDEPTNGLDPEGIYVLRGILRDMANRGTAVLVSSHQLAEMQLLCDRAIFIANGVARGSATMAQLTAGTGQPKARVTFASPELAAAAGALLMAQRPDTTPQAASPVQLVLAVKEAGYPAVMTLLLQGGCPFVSWTPLEITLDKPFLSIVGGGRAIA